MLKWCRSFSKGFAFGWAVSGGGGGDVCDTQTQIYSRHAYWELSFRDILGMFIKKGLGVVVIWFGKTSDFFFLDFFFFLFLFFYCTS